MRADSYPLLLSLALLCPAIPSMAQLPVVDIRFEHDQGNDQILISLRGNDHDFGGVISNLVFTVRWPESSPATLGFGTSAWCPPPSVAFSPVPSAAVSPGNGFKYRTWNHVGLSLISDIIDDGGCGQTLLADTWTPVFTIPVNNDPGGTVFELADDQFVLDDNRSFFVSLGGQASTGGIFSISTGVEGAGGAQLGPRLMPNPASTEVTVLLDAPATGAWAAEVLDAAGRIVLAEQGTGAAMRMRVAALPAGAYRVRVVSENGTAILPLIVER
ncbi:MAG: T9SS type A sorting domain-containing protein [Flavobacteriales bacterium]|nr:MAG: T9SS type A sorting domain-containing protein [Flavobacteriales bacterium]